MWFFSIGPRRPLPYAKLSGTNPKIGTCRGNFSINRLLVEPLIARPLTDSHGNSCLMTVAYSILSWIQQAMSLFVGSLEASEGLYLRHSAARPKKFTRQVSIFRLLPLGLACGSSLRGPILKEPQCGNIRKPIQSSLNCKSPLVWRPAAKNTPMLLTFPTIRHDQYFINMHHINPDIR